MKNLLEIKNVNKSFEIKKGKHSKVLENINFNIGNNEIVSFLGKSGAGKSTMLRMISGLTAPNDGEMSFQNNMLEVGVSNPDIAMVFQSYALLPWLTAYENVALGLKARNLSAADVHAKTVKMLNLIGLSGCYNLYPKELSGGMKQRVGFARALAVEPKLLLLDEPFSSLDIFTSHKLRQDLVGLWETKKINTSSMILVTHNVEEAVMMSDRVLLWDSNPGSVTFEFHISEPRFKRTKRNMLDRIEQITNILNVQIGESENRNLNQEFDSIDKDLVLNI